MWQAKSGILDTSRERRITDVWVSRGQVWADSRMKLTVVGHTRSPTPQEWRFSLPSPSLPASFLPLSLKRQMLKSPLLCSDPVLPLWMNSQRPTQYFCKQGRGRHPAVRTSFAVEPKRGVVKEGTDGVQVSGLQSWTT